MSNDQQDVQQSQRHGRCSRVSQNQKEILVKLVLVDGRITHEASQIAGVMEKTARSIINSYKREDEIVERTRGAACDAISSPAPSRAFAIDDKKLLYRPTTLLQYRSGRSANESHRFLPETMKEQAPSQATCFDWCRKFDNGDDSLKDSRRTGRPHTQNRQLVLATCGAQPDLSVRELSGLTNTPKSTVHDALRPSGKIAKLPQVVSHALTSQDKRKRVDICPSLLNRFLLNRLDRLDRHNG
ncbi:unnamed protein product [Heligmosomoides polygyrus]|uniref:HTH_48 domain-containing protein n=1 Tax=Heligmosomoides polygyrus TaxID=6339 RepID=A0A3P7ZSV4_HELPZ|nr:unnamed protein product [Heligmosomoides polygyrus]